MSTSPNNPSEYPLPIHTPADAINDLEIVDEETLPVEGPVGQSESSAEPDAGNFFSGSTRLPPITPVRTPPSKPFPIWCTFRFSEDKAVSYLVDEDTSDHELQKINDEVVTKYSDLIEYATFEDVLRAQQSRLHIGIYTVKQMKVEVQNIRKAPFLLQDLIARNSITLMVGDSGLGKSPFNYELGLCIASGVPFLGIPTTPGRVLYLDFEDEVEEMIDLAETISQKLGLPEPPEAFRFWSPAMTTADPDPFRLIRAYSPDFVIIDTISAADPKAETENKYASELYNRCRETGAAVEIVHHLKKDSDDESDSSFDLDLDRPTAVQDFHCVRGASALYNNAYLRWKLIRSRANSEEAFIVRGYRRGKGHIPTISVGRILNDNGEPIGHYRVGGSARLSARYREVFTALPERFRWKDLSEHFQNSNSSRTQFINSCKSLELLNSQKDGDYYVKRSE